MEIALYWGYNPELAYEPYEEEVDEYPTKVRNELLLAVVRARDLAPKKGGLFSQVVCRVLR